MEEKKKRHYIYLMLSLFGAAALSIIFFFIIYRYEGFGDGINKIIGILNPMIYGAAIAYLLKPLCNFYNRKLDILFKGKHKGLANGIAVMGSIITGLLIVYLMLIIIIPQVINSITSIFESLPGKLDQAAAWLEKTLEEDTVIAGYIRQIYDYAQDKIMSIAENLYPNLKMILEGLGTQLWNSVLFFKNLLIGIVVAVYLLASRKRFTRQGKMLLYSIVKTKWADMVMTELRYADEMFVGFINGKLLDSLIIGVICYICSLILKFPNAMLISAIIGVTNIIPFFGPFIGAVPAALLIFIESPIKALWFILFIIVLQQVDGNIIGPKILGNTTGLSSFWVLFSILVFGGLWGFVGMVIGVPLFAVIYDVCRKLVLYGLKKNGCEELLEEDEIANGENE